MKTREKLHKLEATRKYVFHGSAEPNIKELEPRQAYHYISSTKRIKDGPPGVAASPYVDIAIFRAVLNKGRTGFETDGKGNLNFYAYKEAFDFAKNVTGYVYVLDKKLFHPKTGYELEMDWRSEKPVKPIKIIRVTMSDLPDNIRKVK